MSEIAGSEAARGRLVASAARDRRVLERALHDGAQQDLIALAVRLQLLRELVSDGPAAAVELVDELRGETHAALDRLRALTNEIYPSILDARGLAEALRDGAGVRVGEVGRHPPEVEAAVYFACRAMLDGVPPGAEPSIAVSEGDGTLLVEVDGGGEADRDRLEDLLAALGGTLTVEPGRAARMRLRAAIPVRGPCL